MAILSKSNGSMMPGRGLINPAFVIKIVPATDDMQQQRAQGRDNPNTDYLDNLKVGASVSAKKGKRNIEGTVERVIKNGEGDVIYVVILDTDGKTRKLNASSIRISGKPNVEDDRGELVSSPGIFTESRILTFEEFVKTKL